MSTAVEHPAVETEALVALVEHASLLGERLGPDFEPRDDAPDRSAEKRLERWRERCGSDAGFKNRLAALDLTPESARRVLGEMRWRGGELPAWTELVREVVELAEAEGAQHAEPRVGDRALDAGQPLPFEPVLLPFVAVARRRLGEASEGRLTLLGEKALAALEHQLLVGLVQLAANSLMAEFEVERSDPFAGSMVFGGPWAAGSRRVFLRFLEGLWRQGFRAWLWRYPYLARRLAADTAAWVDSTATFLEHLEADRQVLRESFGVEVRAGSVEALVAGLSDPHRGRRTVLKLRFESGAEVVYKPRSVESEESFGALLEEMGEVPHPRPTHAVDRGDHGWVEVIRQGPVPDEAAAVHYFERAGALVALVYGLGGTDGHNENLVAAGEHPVLIDLETLAHARMRPGHEVDPEGEGVRSATWSLHWESVFRTGFLPQWDLGPNGESFDISGLGGVGGQRTHLTQPAWKNVNTDAMKRVTTVFETGRGPNRVELDGELVDPGTHLEPLCRGFTLAYERLVALRDGDSPALERLARGTFRLIYRHTKVYQVLSRELRQAHNQRRGIDASLALEKLTRPLLHEPPDSPYWRLVAVELDDLLGGDVPLLEAVRGAASLDAGGERPIPDVLEAASSRLDTQLALLGPEDHRRQLQLIRTAFAITRPETTASAAGPEPLDEGAEPLTQEQLLAETGRIAHRLAAGALGSPDHGVSWISVLFHPSNGRWRLEAAGPRLYDGNTGTALFFAALARAARGGQGAFGGALGFDPQEAQSLARAGLAATRVAIEDPAFHRALYEPGIGAGFGPGSLVLAWLFIGRMLEDEALIEGAERTAHRLLHREVIEADDRLDLLNGTAGALIAWLRLWQATADPTCRDRALHAARHLEARALAAGQGKVAWPTLDGEWLTGFAHGSAGISWALLELYGETGDAWLLDLATASRRFEADFFDPKRGNWVLSGSQPLQKQECRCSWCHGAPGIALSRLNAVYLGDDGASEDLDIAVATTLAGEDHRLDHLCCGALGRIAALHQVGLRRDQPQLVERAQRRAAAVVRRAQARGGRYHLGWDDLELVPSLHQGLAGVGYQLLRLAAPQKVPSLLTWELPR